MTDTRLLGRLDRAMVAIAGTGASERLRRISWEKELDRAQRILDMRAMLRGEPTVSYPSFSPSTLSVTESFPNASTPPSSFGTISPPKITYISPFGQITCPAVADEPAKVVPVATTGNGLSKWANDRFIPQQREYLHYDEVEIREATKVLNARAQFKQKGVHQPVAQVSTVGIHFEKTSSTTVTQPSSSIPVAITNQGKDTPISCIDPSENLTKSAKLNAQSEVQEKAENPTNMVGYGRHFHYRDAPMDWIVNKLLRDLKGQTLFYSCQRMDEILGEHPIILDHPEIKDLLITRLQDGSDSKTRNFLRVEQKAQTTTTDVYGIIVQRGFVVETTGTNCAELKRPRKVSWDLPRSQKSSPSELSGSFVSVSSDSTSSQNDAASAAKTQELRQKRKDSAMPMVVRNKRINRSALRRARSEPRRLALKPVRPGQLFRRRTDPPPNVILVKAEDAENAIASDSEEEDDDEYEYEESESGSGEPLVIRTGPPPSLRHDCISAATKELVATPAADQQTEQESTSDKPQETVLHSTSAPVNIVRVGTPLPAATKAVQQSNPAVVLNPSLFDWRSDRYICLPEEPPYVPYKDVQTINHRDSWNSRLAKPQIARAIPLPTITSELTMHVIMDEESDED